MGVPVETGVVVKFVDEDSPFLSEQLQGPNLAIARPRSARKERRPVAQWPSSGPEVARKERASPRRPASNDFLYIHETRGRSDGRVDGVAVASRRVDAIDANLK